MDAIAKQRLLEEDVRGRGLHRRYFPLEPMVCFIGKEKMTTDTKASITFWAHRRLAREAMVRGNLLSGEQFDLIAWERVSQGLHDTPKMFQLWACKQVWDIVETN